MLSLFLSAVLSLTEIEDRESLRFRFSYEQGSDDSCGLQALSCLLSLYWGGAVSESELILESATSADRKGPLRTSFSDMRRLLTARGFASAAYKMDYGGLAEAVRRYAPVIAHYSRPVGHFVLVLYADSRCVVVSDPAEGCLLLCRSDFEGRWSGFVLLAASTEGVPRREVMAAAVGERFEEESLIEKAMPSWGRRWP